MITAPRLLQWSDFPPDFKVWKLNPAGVVLETQELTDGVYALLSSKPGVNNCGFVVGEDAVLVIDSGISRMMADQILAAVAAVTDKPIRYLVNLNYHADHSFGNSVFPDDTLIVQQRRTAELTPYFNEERSFMVRAVNDDPSVFDGLILRAPDIVFEKYLSLDLGGRAVECHYFGPANTPGDTIVYVPEARAAWTGNMTGGIFGLALESDATTFRQAIAAFIDTLDVKTLVPAHMGIREAKLLDDYLVYFSEVADGVQTAVDAGWSLDETMERVTESAKFILPPDDPMSDPMHGRHLYNVRKTYLSLTAKTS